ncbi:MAG TPA: ankyrin repeat domain-containing protein [Chitinophagaceae bacterium]|nr:ankyrin repeat domain-containing protein [Chitinophagaceae bacterium]
MFKVKFIWFIIFIFCQTFLQAMPLNKDKQALVKALKGNNISAIKKLAKKIYKYDLNLSTGVKKIKPLLFSINAGWTDIAMQLIKDNIAINETDNGNTSLMYACENLQPTLVKAILDKKVNPNMVNNFGTSSLFSVGKRVVWDGPLQEYQRMRYEIVDLLLKHGTNPNSSDHPIFEFCDNKEILKLLIKNGANYTSSNNNIFLNRQTGILHYAAINGDSTVINYMIDDLKLPINQPDSLGWTPLHHAAFQHNILAIKALLAKGADKKLTTIKDYQSLFTGYISPIYPAGLTPYDIYILRNIKYKSQETIEPTDKILEMLKISKENRF